ncbi:PTS sugar transporter subunit IIA [Enterobacter cloacae complex sp. I1]|uniref:fructose PTS transporter subunit IIA n=1 Tax=Enterobacter TaxID=547 RepID=UPI001868F8AE|nr:MULTISPECIES: fructose PTS transporter subunit IIA [Enterobacter]MBE3462812.1 PTS sugar transporter subunit IIA [Enterobacter cloacae complex sp. P20C]MBE3471219.1 PTS sugar transporter subunit IIA [Enterobacter cloacae complex sp. P20B]MBE3494302.1 PTS sugar transporter subunit IIA [Enterobacter cloacae complex sp. P17RS]MBE3508112.1 PTS sugar transporter subunit IIA [Enterobacter cloacae complex sp. I10]MBE3525727.1 PTS sugar transporter subunit IIA [Enterobacter cloacae complex sp. I9]
MNLLALTNPDRVFINPPHRTPEALIRWMTEPLARQKIISDEAAFIQSVLQRESEGPTALGEALAVPHGKSQAVQQAAFCLALFDDPIRWPGLEGDEEVRMVFLLAIPPAEAGSTHMQLLTTLTRLLMEDRVREQLLAARTREEALSALNTEEPTNENEASENTFLIPLILGSIATAAFLQAGLSWLCGGS